MEIGLKTMVQHEWKTVGCLTLLRNAMLRMIWIPFISHLILKLIPKRTRNQMTNEGSRTHLENGLEFGRCSATPCFACRHCFILRT